MNKTFYFQDALKRFLFVNKRTLVTILVIMLLGVLAGIFCSSKIFIFIDINCVQNIPLRLFLLNKMSIIGYVFLSILFYFCVFFIILLLSFAKFGSIFIFCILTYLCYAFGVDLSVIFISFGSIKGIVVATIGLFPFCALVFFTLSIFASNLLCFNNRLNLCGSSRQLGDEFRYMLNYLYVVSGILFVQSILIFVLIKIIIF